MHYFSLSPENWPDDPSKGILLEGPEAHHMLKALRLGLGDEVRLLDGKGREALCRIKKANKRDALLVVENDVRHPEPEAKVILAAGWGKAARRGWILEKAVELEASALWFWQAERSQFPVPAEAPEAWRGRLAAGAKQCRNPWLPEVRTLPGGAAQVAQAAARADFKQLLVEKDYAAQGFLAPGKLGLRGVTVCVVGPEGGFTPEEVDTLAKAGFETLSMGERILRWETAAMMALGLHWWKRNIQG